MLRRLGIPYVSLNPGATYRGLHDSLVNHLGNERPGMLLCLHEDHAVADLSRFKRSGGKLILLDSVNDGVFSAWYLTRWYLQMTRETTGAHEFARFYLVPNMAHCGGGPATTNFSGNLLTAITDWVERHRAPDTIIAANTSTSSPFPAGGIFDPRIAANFPTGGTRPLCPYPQTTQYKGSGPTNVASSFVCVSTDHGDHGDAGRDDGDNDDGDPH
jgi:feruloyl esterase